MLIKGIPICKPGTNKEAADADIAWAGTIPVVFSDTNGFFSADNVEMTQSGFRQSWTRRIGRYLPKLGLHKVDLLDLLSRHVEKGQGRALIIGAGDNAATNNSAGEMFDSVILTDVVHSPDIDIICDGQELPFPSGSFDAVIVIAVLEHVLSPAAVAAEIKRVLKDEGVVLHDSPFMQSVHMGAYDFTRFTELGYRWLFREFAELERGCSIGPASALCWAISGFLSGFMPDRLAKLFTRLAFFWLKYFDYLPSKSTYDAGGGYYFIGRNSGKALGTSEILEEYRGNL